jgi:RNA recognition motif-containing protein
MKLYVGNLPYQGTETQLQDFFAEAGVQIDAVSIMYDRFSGESRGFGFVEIDDEGQAQRAIEACNGKDFMGRALVINEARPMGSGGGGGGGGRPPRQGGGGGYGGGRGSGGGGGRGGRNRY